MIIASLLSNISLSFLLLILDLPPEMDGADFQQFEEEEGDEAEWMQEMDEDDDVDDEEPLTNIQSNSNVHSFT